MRKIVQIREMLIKENLEGVLITKNHNFHWITDGNGHIAISSEKSISSIFISQKSIVLLTNNIEEKRLLQEEIGSIETFVYKWYECEYDALKNIVKNIEKIGCDDNLYNLRNIENELKEIRIELNEEEKELYISEGNEMMKIFETAVLSLTPDMTELQAQAIVSKKLIENKFLPLVLLVFSDKRRMMYRHNLPSFEKLGNTFFVSTCSFRKGPIVSMTRSVSYNNSLELKEQHKINSIIEAQTFDYIKKGIFTKDIFFKIQEFYKSNGYETEMSFHHQGGIIGYKTREEIVTPSSNIKIKNNMAFCFNPTITGTKSEDTFFIEKIGKKWVSWNEEKTQWPILKFNINGNMITRPDILIK